MSISLIIVIITSLISYQAMQNRAMFDKLKHSPFAEKRNKEYYRFLSSGFVHGGWLHLLINMYVLYEFGGIVEQKFLMIFGEMMGRVNFLLLYFLTIVFADIPTYLKFNNSPHFASVGASGGVSGIVFVYVLFYPWQKIYLYGILGIPGIVAALAYIGYSTWASKNKQDHIDHDAHLYGAVFGFLFAIVLKPSLFSDFTERLVAGMPF